MPRLRRDGALVLGVLMKKILFALAALLFLSAAPPHEKRNFLLVTIDTWRADYISASGSGRVQTPFLDRLAREGSFIPRVDAPAPLTTPSHASILTGLYPSNHGIRDNSHFKLKDDVKTMPELFREKGYRTIAVVSAAPLRRVYGLDRGFDVYDDRGIGVEGDEALVPSSRDAGRSASRALEAVGASKGGGLFVWLHLYDPHYPYEPPQEFRRKCPGDAYAGEVAYVDKVIGGFVTQLVKEKRGSWSVLVTGDHGEGLGDKGEMTHGFLLYKQTREVPLILWESEKKTPHFGLGAKGLVDILPAVIELFSLDHCKCDGVSLFLNTSGTRWLFSEAIGPLMDFCLNPALLARKDEKVYIRHGTSAEVYRGGDEERNIAHSEKSFSAAADAELKRLFGDNPVPSPNMKLNEDELRALAGLGYIGSSAGAPRKVTPCDLRDFSSDFSKYYSAADEERARGDFDSALSHYDKMISKYPNAPVLRVDKGYLLMDMERYGEAKHEFLACLKLDGRNANALLNLGNIADKEGNFKEAEKFYISALKCDDGKASAHYNLGIFYAENGKSVQAIEHLRRFVELAPNAPQRASIEELINSLKAAK